METGVITAAVTPPLKGTLTVTTVETKTTCLMVEVRVEDLEIGIEETRS